jgi:6-phosphogluconolactonase (cycloisomerase 2 family)
MLAIFTTVALLLGTTIVAFADDSHGTGTVGAVYTMTNAADGNQIVVFDRKAGGLLTLVGAIDTGGHGSGPGPARNGLDSLESQDSLVLTRDNRWLLAVNAGSNEISVFRVKRRALELVDKVSSEGEFPVSLAVFDNLVYVLNAESPNITGFSLGQDGQLDPLADSTRELGTGGFAQVGFDPRGNNLVVTDRGENEILVFPVDRHGLAAMASVTSPSNGIAPFGFTFDQQGHLLVSEAGSGAVSSYDIGDDGSLQIISPSIANDQAATCWIARNHMGFVFSANTGSGTISVYKGIADGQLELLDAMAGIGVTPLDIGISVDDRFLYALDPVSETIDMFRIQADGSLTDLGTIAGGLSIFAQGIAVR